MPTNPKLKTAYNAVRTELNKAETKPCPQTANTPPLLKMTTEKSSTEAPAVRTKLSRTEAELNSRTAQVAVPAVPYKYNSATL